MASKLFFPRAPWKTNGLPLESIWRVCVVEIKKRPHDLCAIWFPVQLREEHKQKKWLMLEQCIVRWRFDKQAFSLSLSQMKEMCHLSRKNSPGFHYFVCPSVPAFVSPTASEVVFSRGRGLHCISLPAFFLIFLPSSFSFIQNLEPDLCLPSHTKKFEWPRWTFLFIFHASGSYLGGSLML